MSAPLAGLSAAQLAQQKLTEQGAQQATAKAGPSKFDQALKTQASQGVQAPQQVQQAQHVSQAHQVQQAQAISEVQQAQKAQMNKVNVATGTQADPGKSTTKSLSELFADMEKGQSVMDQLISGGVKGKNFSHAELLSLQAGMYKYTQELELTGKVVEKATTGLKDTLKTQV